MPRLLLASLLLAVALAAPASAAAPDALVVADPAAAQITALDGTLVWVTGSFGHQRLMKRTADGVVAPVSGTRAARSYRSIDLGHNSDGGLLLTYLRCDAGSPCQALWNDLDGRRATFRKLAPAGCEVSTAPSRWRTRIAYGLACRGSASSRKRSGLYVKTGAHAAVRLPRPHDAVTFGVTQVDSVDLRGTRVAAVVADINEYSYSQTVAGTGMRSFLAAASEGESGEDARGLAIESSSTHWTLTDATHAGDPDEAIIFRQAGDCLQRERLIGSTPAQEFLATDVAADGGRLYLLVPGAGIATHTFTPDPTPSCG